MAKAALVTEYALVVKRSAQKELDDLTDTLFTRIDTKILALADDPRPTGCKKLAGMKDHWRIRIGDYRVIYKLDETAKEITIIKVAHRGQVYER